MASQGNENIAFKARSRDAKYVALLNNDAIPMLDSLAKMELGAVQGVILNLEGNKIDTAGNYLSRFVYGAPLLRGAKPPGLRKLVYVTYTDGAYTLVRVKAVIRVMRGEKLFYDEVFGYCDDSILGIRLWEAGYSVAAFPFIAARHLRGATFGRINLQRIYYSTRCVSIFYRASKFECRRKIVVKAVYLRKNGSFVSKTW